jgi:hypothetical protein
MKALAERLGIAPARIIVEDRSSRTAENAREVAELLRAFGEVDAARDGAGSCCRAKLCFENGPRCPAR